MPRRVSLSDGSDMSSETLDHDRDSLEAAYRLVCLSGRLDSPEDMSDEALTRSESPESDQRSRVLSCCVGYTFEYRRASQDVLVSGLFHQLLSWFSRLLDAIKEEDSAFVMDMYPLWDELCRAVEQLEYGLDVCTVSDVDVGLISLDVCLFYGMSEILADALFLAGSVNLLARSWELRLRVLDSVDFVELVVLEDEVLSFVGRLRDVLRAESRFLLGSHVESFWRRVSVRTEWVTGASCRGRSAIKRCLERAILEFTLHVRWFCSGQVEYSLPSFVGVGV